MTKTMELNILGKRIALYQRDASSLKGLSVGDKLSYTFYNGSYMNTTMLFLQPKSENPTPRTCEITAQRLSEKMDLPIVFILKNGPTYERQRLLDKGVYFVMSEKFAHLPMLMAMEKVSNKKAAKRLTPVAQYMLLYHLQVRSIIGLSARQMQEVFPYSYSSITLGMTCLEEVGLAHKQQLEDRSNVLAFELKGKELWEASSEYLISPIERRIYCDGLSLHEVFATSGINALAHYSMLNPDREQMIAITTKQFKALDAAGAFEGLNLYDGHIMIELWKYPAIKTSDDSKYADPLSVALSLADDEDPRVEGEVERMINNITWKD